MITRRVAPEEEQADELSVAVILQDSLLSGKYKKHLKKKRREQQKEGLGDAPVQRLRELTEDEEELLSRTDAQWLKLIIVNTPKYRLDKQRIALVEQLTDFNLQYDEVYKVLKGDQLVAQELIAKFNKARDQIKENIDQAGQPLNPQGMIDPLVISSLHRLKFLQDHIKSVLESIEFFDMILMDILDEEMKINQALTILKTTGVMNSLNNQIRYARGLDLSFSTQMVTKEFKAYIKQLRQRQPLDKLIATHQAGKQVALEQSETSKVTTATLLGLLDDSPLLRKQLDN